MFTSISLDIAGLLPAAIKGMEDGLGSMEGLGREAFTAVINPRVGVPSKAWL